MTGDPTTESEKAYRVIDSHHDPPNLWPPLDPPKDEGLTVIYLLVMVSLLCLAVTLLMPEFPALKYEAKSNRDPQVVKNGRLPWETEKETANRHVLEVIGHMKKKEHVK